MPSKKRKYNARFPAGRIKKIMQTDEEVGKVAQAVPIIISRTLELFVESLLTKAMQVTVSRHAKTLSPSHVKQCILAESRFDFLKDLVKNVPDVSLAEENEKLSGENSPNCSRYPDATVQNRRLAREDSNSSSSSDVRTPPIFNSGIQGASSQIGIEPDLSRLVRTETVTSASLIKEENDAAIDLSTKVKEEPKIKVNFYQETLNLNDDLPQQSVITVNPKYAQPSTSAFSHKVDFTLPKTQFRRTLNTDNIDLNAVNSSTKPTTPKLSTPVTPVINIDFSKNICNPEIKVLNSSPIIGGDFNNQHRIGMKSYSNETKYDRSLPSSNIDLESTGNLQIDEDYDT